MSMPKLYNAHPKTLEYLEGQDTEAAQNRKYSPETHDPADQYQYNPRTSSLIQPPSVKKNEKQLLIDGQWQVVPDFRGKVYFDTANGQRHEITELDIEPESSWTEKERPNGTEWDPGTSDWVKTKDTLKTEINTGYYKHLGLGLDVSSLGDEPVKIQINPASLQRLGFTYTEMLAKERQGQTDIGTIVRAMDNSKHPATLDQFEKMILEIGAHVSPRQRQNWDDKDALLTP